MIKKLRLKLAARLMIFFILATVLLTALSGIFLGKGLSRHFQENVHPFLIHHLHYIHDEIGMPPDTRKAADIASRLPMQIHIFGPDLSWASNGQPIYPADIQQRPRRFIPPVHRKKHQKLVPGFIDGRLVLKNSVNQYDFYYVMEEGSGIRRIGFFGWLLIASVIAVFALTYLYTRWLFKPISAIREGVERIGNGQLGQAIKTGRTDELGELADYVNRMAAQIESMLNAKRELLLAISHELRSPITRAKVNLALLDSQENTRLISDDLDEMEALITNLLESEQLNSQHVVLQKQTVAINAWISEVISENHWSEQIQTDLTASKGLHFSVDITRIKLMLKNIIENALRHNRPEIGYVILNTFIDNNTLIIRIQDFGTGIAAEHLEFLTDAFYRADPARQRKTGGYGLGLYLCRLIIEAHGGTLTISSELNQFTCVEINLPNHLA